MRGIENNVKVYVIDSSFSPTLSDAPSVNVVVDGSGNPTILIGWPRRSLGSGVTRDTDARPGEVEVDVASGMHLLAL
ncbi:hypothetical protein V6N13_033948 [Hibiscus sabdariffa]